MLQIHGGGQPPHSPERPIDPRYRVTAAKRGAYEAKSFEKLLKERQLRAYKVL